MSYNSTEITLPSGATVVLKDPRMLLVKDRNFVLECADHESKLAMATGLQAGLIAVMVDSWSFDLIPPSVSIKSIEMLTPADYEALVEVCMPAQKALFPSIQNPEDAHDPKAIIANFSA